MFKMIDIIKTHLLSHSVLQHKGIHLLFLNRSCLKTILLNTNTHYIFIATHQHHYNIIITKKLHGVYTIEEQPCVILSPYRIFVRRANANSQVIQGTEEGREIVYHFCLPSVLLTSLNNDMFFTLATFKKFSKKCHWTSASNS